MGFDVKSVQNNLKLHDEVKLSMQKALLGSIPSNLRALGVGYDEENVLFVSIYEDSPSDDDIDAISCAITEASTYFGRTDDDKYITLDEKYITVPYPEYLGEYAPNWGWVYLRKEPVDFIRIPKGNG